MNAAEAVVKGLVRDQALGLRLMALARVAAGVHMGMVAMGDRGAEVAREAREREGGPAGEQVLRSQAAGLARLMGGQTVDGSTQGDGV